ncbi:MAG TPA: LuxR C-terminal-related transcriptional regulator [Gemmatimonadaceae bacterium]|nr:LuxR C-terminal-related transcriptional regulator [Gemmatimonadaceae bacterium]
MRSPSKSSSARASASPNLTVDLNYAAGRRALAGASWGEARSHLQLALATHETPEALEDIALAAWWLDDSRLVFESRERAYSLYRTNGDQLGAARVAVWLTWDYLAFRGDFAVAAGWLERARSILSEASLQRTAEYGWLLIREGEVALFRGHDPRVAIERAIEATRIGREVGDQSVEFTALALEGLARVNTGDVAGGMKRLDEATIAATTGDMKELHAVGVVCCWQIFACERVRDYDRAAQWCARVQEFGKRWGSTPLTATCRTQYAGVLMWRGEWDRAEAELSASAREFERASRPSLAGPAFARLGELRLRQGLVDEARQLFEQAGSLGQARLGLAELMLLEGKAGESVALIEQVLAQLGPAEATLRAGALELIVRAHAASHDTSAAAAPLDELERIADSVGTEPLRASASLARAVVLREFGELAHAVNCFERAIRLFEASGAPFETARTRGWLAEAYLAMGRREPAEREGRLAVEALASLGATREAARVRRQLETDGDPAGGKRALPITPRQIDILRLVAKGMSNAEIAERLELSEHTVKRHVANLLMKLDLPSRAAAAAYAAREGLA